ncbi:dihydrofolate reductase [Coemansia sp. RSA 2675]|uniref:Dihydrofolate reductase n=1 Tax=Coemansia linderi TaxID=2663919 RepID=A0ACC1KDZ5_9FUNG|nr:dihydrofolate reductase [Coemansia sp. RSA 2675]KAJ2409717.1 dihydrofolate reductase [Coemansia sp. RSA 2530]KAJ2694833.1 dihydrofolate reductase [Coemansia sp. IMI 209128]KAJ2788531.1 dihydrofolate reductase [Coemansia linderi]
MSGKTLVLITAAAAKNNGIGAKYALPWRLPKDLKYFNQVTTPTPATDGPRKLMNACILGRKTWESFPDPFRPLPNRYNIVITSNPDLIPSDVPHSAAVSSFAAALAHIDWLNSQQDQVLIDRVFVVGGGRVYQEAMETPGHHVQIFFTRVEFPDADICDAFFPHIDTTRFKLQPHQRLIDVATFNVPSGVQTESGLDYEFLMYEDEATRA